MAATQDFDVDQGSYWSQELLWKDENDDPVDLSNYSARMQLRRRVTSPTVLLSLDDGGLGGITLGGLAGTILLELDADQTSSLPARQGKRFVYDLELVPAGGKVHRLLQGKFVVSPEVTR
jgi:hypothetical protein